MSGINVSPMTAASYPSLSLLDQKKGSLGNRVDCAIENTGNNISTNVKTGLIVAGGAGITYATTKSSILKNGFIKVDNLVKAGVNKILNSTVGKDAVKFIKPAIEFAKKSPLCVKAAVVLGLLGTISSYLVKAGQIDQKYNDRAKAQKGLSV